MVMMILHYNFSHVVDFWPNRLRKYSIISVFLYSRCKERDVRWVKHYLLIKKLINRNEKLNRKVEKYTIKCYRLREDNISDSSLLSQLKRDLRKFSVPPEIRQRLLFNGVEESRRKMRSIKKKRLYFRHVIISNFY